jgi:hypothetical protein
MAKSRALTIEEVSQLGAEQLAQLLLAAAEDDTALMRGLRIAVASRNGAAEAAAEIDVEIKRIKRGKVSIDPQRAHDFARDLKTLREAIEGPLADADPVMALERMFDFIDLAPSVIERSENGDGVIGDLFDEACDAAAVLAAQAAPALAPERATFRAYQTYLGDEYGIADGIVAAFARILDEVSRAALRSWIEADLARLPLPADSTSAAERLPEWKLVHALADVADAAGDVDAYCAAQNRLGPRVRNDAGMAKRLLDAGRAAEAYAIIEKAEPNLAKNAIELADLRIAALSALGRRDEAQAARWEEFTRTLREQPLRDLLKHLPDFEDTEKEREALVFAANFHDPLRALEFLTAWPDPRGAAALVRRRVHAIDGNCYWLLGPAAERLEAKEPLAATLLYRRMIDFTLDRARSSRYGHAARHLASCACLANAIADWHGNLPHTEYADDLRRRHGRKSGFWNRINSN